MSNKPSKNITVIANLIYGPTGKYSSPRRVELICDASKQHIWEGAALKEVTQDNLFIISTGDGAPVKNENGNRGVSFSRFIKEERGCKPIDNNMFNVTVTNWKK